MPIGSIKQKLHNYLEIADDKKLEAMYIMLEDDIKKSAVQYTDEFKKELDLRYAEYESGKAKMITAAQSKRRVQKILKSGHEK